MTAGSGRGFTHFQVWGPCHGFQASGRLVRRVDKGMTMSDSAEPLARHTPGWCVLQHGAHAGEEDQVHVSDSTFVRYTMVRLCMTVDPVTWLQDGPYILLGSDEYSLEDTALLIEALTSLLDLGRATIPRTTA